MDHKAIKRSKPSSIDDVIDEIQSAFAPRDADGKSLFVRYMDSEDMQELVTIGERFDIIITSDIVDIHSEKPCRLTFTFKRIEYVEWPVEEVIKHFSTL